MSIVSEAPQPERIERRFSDSFLLPEITGLKPSSDELQYGYSYDVVVCDPYVESLSHETRSSIDLVETSFAQMATENLQNGLWANDPAVVYDSETDRKKRIFGDIGEDGTMQTFSDYLDSPGYVTWKKLLPSPKALEFLAGPEAYQYVVDRNGSRIPIDDNFSSWLKGCLDAQGIRSRAAIMAWLIDDHIKKTGNNSPDWVSVACGTALPAFQTAAHVNEGFSPNMRLIDTDISALKRAEELHGLFNVNGNIKTEPNNIFDPNVLADGEADIIDAMGIFEYISPALIEMLEVKYGIKTSPGLFLASCYRALKPGGKLIFGQMREDRKNKNFTLGTIGWPYIHTLNPIDVEKIVIDAGIDSSGLSTYTPQDGVYTVYTIDKPL